MSAATGDAVRPARFAYASFAIMIAGWVAFAVALAASRQTLDEFWTAVRDLRSPSSSSSGWWPSPFLVGLAIWRASWSEPARLAAIALVAAAYTVLFIPRDRQR